MGGFADIALTSARVRVISFFYKVLTNTATRAKLENVD